MDDTAEIPIEQVGPDLMPSNALMKWEGERSESLDEIENAHVMVGGSERGRRYATQQINYAYATMLSSQFQGYCRDLHSECVDHLIDGIPAHLVEIIQIEFMWNRALSKGNPRPGAIGADFTRLAADFWNDICGLDARNHRRREVLEQLIAWRNAIAHQDFKGVAPTGNATLHLAQVRAWRSALHGLARDFDQAMWNHLQKLTGAAPW